jgi:uncharacterized protein
VKVVFDTNVLIAAFVSEGICFKLLSRARRRQFELITCPFILKEFEAVLVKKFSAGRQEIKEALRILAEAACSIVYPEQAVSGICRDPDDDNILSCLKAASADYLVSGDTDLLEIGQFEQTRMITPREFETLFED